MQKRGERVQAGVVGQKPSTPPEVRETFDHGQHRLGAGVAVRKVRSGRLFNPALQTVDDGIEQIRAHPAKVPVRRLVFHPCPQHRSVPVVGNGVALKPAAQLLPTCMVRSHRAEAVGQGIELLSTLHGQRAK